MAHEELKALYEIDKQHSDDPDQYWEIKCTRGNWLTCREPAFYAGTEYRRKPDAPVWPVSDDAEDARKWRELEAFCRGNGIMDTAKKFLEIIEPKPALIQGYTTEQWQTIIDGKFLCEFSDCEWNEDSVFSISTLTEINQTSRVTFSSPIGARYNYCRPLRIKGVRQPWFGGECPVTGDVVIRFRNGESVVTDELTWREAWEHTGGDIDIVEFIEL